MAKNKNAGSKANLGSFQYKEEMSAGINNAPALSANHFLGFRLLKIHVAISHNTEKINRCLPCTPNAKNIGDTAISE
ncbi:hypothetical protein GCM10011430_16120 [Oxalicibacterium solurbis]|uniref:Uncharacterized protein n=1 Tax=Oxalicibacterium solurbis TaxID=69280 RepID=A0A8J3F9A3_9BURK|nr:hypothetical protein GCM10011430_16120 [Oxalicibacterium solurbis]